MKSYRSRRTVYVLPKLGLDVDPGLQDEDRSMREFEEALAQGLLVPRVTPVDDGDIVDMIDRISPTQRDRVFI